MPSSRKPKNKPTWSDVKAKLAGFDRAQLLGVVADLYSASRDNQTFLHARFGVVEDPLEAYKATISRWVYPDVFEREVHSVAKAKKAIADYRKAVGRHEGLGELMTFYCEQASTFAADVGMDDEGFFNALVAMFEHALQALGHLDGAARQPLLARLEIVRSRCLRFGYCAGDDIDDLWNRWSDAGSGGSAPVDAQ
jgi:hypothetical protein